MSEVGHLIINTEPQYVADTLEFQKVSVIVVICTTQDKIPLPEVRHRLGCLLPD